MERISGKNKICRRKGREKKVTLFLSKGCRYSFGVCDVQKDTEEIKEVEEEIEFPSDLFISPNGIDAVFITSDSIFHIKVHCSMD